MRVLVFCFLHKTPEEPDNEVTRQNGGESKGNAYLHKVPRLYFVTFFAKNTDTCDIRARADRRDVSAESCAHQKSKIEYVGLDRHCRSNSRNNGKHREHPEIFSRFSAPCSAALLYNKSSLFVAYSMSSFPDIILRNSSNLPQVLCMSNS